MPDMMMFPKTIDEFMERYKITDTEHVYTNGTDLVPIFRMKQWFEHTEAEPIRHGKWVDDRVAFYKQCSECGAYVRANLYEVFLDCDIRDLHYCPNCGAKMDLKDHYCDRNKCLQMDYNGKGCEECEETK